MDEKSASTDATDDQIAIELIVRRDSDPIEGTLTPSQGRPAPFTGWMQLTQLLARALDSAG